MNEMIGLFGGLLLVGLGKIFFLHMPTSSSDWASWLQAIGSVGAIIGAFMVGNRQVVEGRRLDAERRAEEEISRFEKIKALLTNLHVLIKAMQNPDAESPSLDPEDPRTIEYMWGIANSLTAIPVLEIPHPDLIVYVFNLVPALRQLEDEFNNVHGLRVLGALPPTETVTDLVNRFNEVAKILSDAGKLCDAESEMLAASVVAVRN